MKTCIYRWGPAIVLMVIIFLASATPGSKIPEFGYWDLFVKKGGHMIGYALLAAAYYHALNNGKGGTRLQFILAIGIAALYAASDEWHQKFTPGRNASLADVGIDVIGGLIGITAWRLMQRFLRTPNEAADTCLK
jgi:VanZ family protein